MIERQSQNWAHSKFSLKNIQKYLVFKQKPTISIKETLGKIAAAFISCILAHELIYLLQSKYRKHQYMDFFQTIRTNYYTNRTPIRHSTITFTTKLLIDFTDSRRNWQYSEYKKGAITGLIAYILNRPLDQIQTAKNIILQNQNKNINFLQALRVVLRHDGLKGFYKHQNLLGPLASAVHRSIYFGLYNRLTNIDKNPLSLYILWPLLASLGSSLSTIILDKLRTSYILKNMQRERALQKRNNKNMIDSTSITKQLFSYIIKGQFTISKQQITTVSLIVFKNWILLSLFALGQDHLHLHDYLTLSISSFHQSVEY